MSRECAVIRPIISERVTGLLDAERRRQVEAHLHECQECARLAQDLQTLGSLLHNLPRQQTSVGFEARLAERLARRTQRKPSWRVHFIQAWTFQPLLRPALALGVATIALGAITLSGLRTPPPAAPVVAPSDQALLTHCVDQHQNDVAAQPLSDPAAQNLAAHLDNSPGDILGGNPATPGSENP